MTKPKVILILMNMWYNQICFKDSADRRIQLIRFINFYNTVKPYKGLKKELREGLCLKGIRFCVISHKYFL
ncbi:MAG: hypothetical protein KF839_13140 [Nitrosomonas sp.]|nr:hypothetical protein [Nitrosomonas sp.]